MVVLSNAENQRMIICPDFYMKLIKSDFEIQLVESHLSPAVWTHSAQGYFRGFDEFGY